MEAGDMLILVERYRKVYSTVYHIGIILGESIKDPYFSSRRFIVLWSNGETGDYVESTLEGAWCVISRKDV